MCSTLQELVTFVCLYNEICSSQFKACIWYDNESEHNPFQFSYYQYLLSEAYETTVVLWAQLNCRICP